MSLINHKNAAPKRLCSLLNFTKMNKMLLKEKNCHIKSDSITIYMTNS